MRVLDQKLVRDLWRTRGMLMAIVAIVAVGIACLVGLVGTSRNLSTALEAYYSRCRMADFWIDLKRAPVSELEFLGLVKGVAALRQRISYPVVVDIQGVAAPVSGQLLSLPDVRRPVTNDIILKSGRYFSRGRQEEVIVLEPFAKARGLTVGDSIDLVMKGQKKTLVIIATATSPESAYLMPPGSITPAKGHYGVFFVKRSFAEETLGIRGAFNSLVGMLTPKARENPQPVLDELERKLKTYGVFASIPLALQSSNQALHSELGGLATMSTFMPLIFLMVAALVLNVLMTRLAAGQRTVVGTLKALGYSNREIFVHFLKMGAVVGVLGAVLGSLLGYWIAGAMTGMYGFFFSLPDLGNRIYPSLIWISLAVSLVFSLLGTLRGVQKVVGLSPAEAMRQAAPEGGGAILLERWPGLWSRLGFKWQMVLRGMFRKKARTLIGVFAAAMGSSLLVATFGTLDSFVYMVEFQFNKVLLSDYDISLRTERSYAALDEALKLPGAIRGEPVLVVHGTLRHLNASKKVAIKGILPNASMTVPCKRDGSAVKVPERGFLLTARLARQLGAAPGDFLIMTPTKGEQRPTRVKVAATVDSYFGLDAYADYRYLNSLVGEAAALNLMQLRTSQSPSQADQFMKLLKRFPVLETMNRTSWQKAGMETDFIGKMSGMAYPMIIFGAVIFFGSILNSSLIAIVERQREIATFRVVGYRPGEVGSVFLRENLLQNMVGAFLGLPLGYWMLTGLAGQITNDMYAMPAVVNPVSWLYCVGLALAFVLVSQLVVQRSIAKLDWNQALAMKE